MIAALLPKKFAASHGTWLQDPGIVSNLERLFIKQYLRI